MVSYRESFPREGSTSTFGKAVASFSPDEPRARASAKRARGNTGKQHSSRAVHASQSKPKESAFSKVVKLCAQRDRSETELQKRLAEYGYTEAEANEAVSRAVDCNLVDANRFAEAFIRGSLSRGWGSVKIERELMSKHGIDIHGISDLDTSCFDEDTQIARACAFLDTHPPHAKDMWAAAYRKLLAKGYPTSVANTATRMWVTQNRSTTDDGSRY